MVEEEEEEFEEKMVPASIFLTSSAPLDLSLRREDFQGKDLWMIMRMMKGSLIPLGGRLLSQVNEYSCKFFGYSVIHHGRLCVIGTPEKPSLLLHCVNKDIYWCQRPFHRISLKGAVY